MDDTSMLATTVSPPLVSMHQTGVDNINTLPVIAVDNAFLDKPPRLRSTSLPFSNDTSSPSTSPYSDTVRRPSSTAATSPESSPHSSSSALTSSHSPNVPPQMLLNRSRCVLCNNLLAAAQTLPCTRCGLLPSYSEPIDARSNPLLMHAARAYKFKLMATMTPLVSEISSIVVDYLIWYRGTEDFHIGDRVDARDQRGHWYGAHVVQVAPEAVLVHYSGFTSKWDSWHRYDSQTLAPYGSRSCRIKRRESTTLNQTIHNTRCGDGDDEFD